MPTNHELISEVLSRLITRKGKRNEEKTRLEREAAQAAQLRSQAEQIWSDATRVIKTTVSRLNTRLGQHEAELRVVNHPSVRDADRTVGSLAVELYEAGQLVRRLGITLDAKANMLGTILGTPMSEEQMVYGDFSGEPKSAAEPDELLFEHQGAGALDQIESDLLTFLLKAIPSEE
jgi:hypothetical protein